MALLDPRNGPSGDLAPYGGAPRAWICASLPRTGSTLLCDALAASGWLGVPKEYLNPMQLRDWEVRFGRPVSRLRHLPLSGPGLALVGWTWGPGDVAAHLARVASRRTGRTGWFGLKLHGHHRERWFDRHGLVPEDLLGPVRWLRVTRADRLAQAVSWARALQTGRWASTQRALLPPRYDRAAITARLAAIEAQESSWDAWFTRRGVTPLTLTYEEVSADLHGAVCRVHAAFGEPAPAPSPPRLARQADALSAAWIARYRAGG